MSHYKKTLAFGKHQLTLETGEIARQASGAVMVSLDDTVVLVTVVGRKDAKPDQDFFPLTVDYQEKTYAAGKIPGGFFKREGRPSEKEILTSRLIDRPLRPLFPESFYNEVQIVATVMSSDSADRFRYPFHDWRFRRTGDFRHPVRRPDRCSARGLAQRPVRAESDRDGTGESQNGSGGRRYRTAVLMVESEAQELSEDVMLGAVVFGHEQMQAVIQAINEMADAVGARRLGLDRACQGRGADRQDRWTGRERAEAGLCDPLRNRRAPMPWNAIRDKVIAAIITPENVGRRTTSTICSARWKPRSCAARS